MGSGSILNCAILHNEAPPSSDAGGAGGGIHCRGSSPEIENCTVYANRTELGGGVYCPSEAWPTIINSILWANGDEVRLS
ncbi:hypothetical protein J7M28_05550 [bacterium]|nr:hypothetical protein [bacterium]